MRTAEIVAVPTSLLARNSLLTFVKANYEFPESREKKKKGIFAGIKEFYGMIYREFTFLVHSQDDYYFGRIILEIEKAEKVVIYIPSGLTKSGVLLVFGDRLERALTSNVLNLILCAICSVIVIMSLVTGPVPGSIWIPLTWPVVIPPTLPVLWMGFKRMREDFKIRRMTAYLKKSSDLIFSDVEESLQLTETRERILETFHSPVLTKDLYTELIGKIYSAFQEFSQSEKKKMIANSLLQYYQKTMLVSPDETYIDRLSRLWGTMLRKWVGRFKWFNRIDKILTAFEVRYAFNPLVRMGLKLPKYIYTSGWFMPARLLIRILGIGAVIYYTMYGWLTEKFWIFWSWITQIVGFGQ